jgi:hypothetical protein
VLENCGILTTWYLKIKSAPQDNEVDRNMQRYIFTSDQNNPQPLGDPLPQ